MKKQLGFTAVEGLALLIVAGLIGLSGLFVWKNQQANDRYNNDLKSSFYFSDYTGNIQFYFLANRTTSSLKLNLPKTKSTNPMVISGLNESLGSIRGNKPIQASETGNLIAFATADCKGAGEGCDQLNSKLIIYTDSKIQELVKYDYKTSESDAFTQTIDDFILNPSGKSIVYLIAKAAELDKQTTYDIHEVDISTKRDAVIASGLEDIKSSAYDTPLSWADDGSVRFYSGVGANDKILEYNVKSGMLTKQTYDIPECDFKKKTCDIAYPQALSPDGSYVLIRYSTDNNVDENTIWGFLLLDLRTGHREKLAEFKGQYGSVYWSPDSSKIAFSHDSLKGIRSIGSKVQTLEIKNKKLSTIYDPGLDNAKLVDDMPQNKYIANTLGWSPEGMFLAIENDGKLKIYSAKNKNIIETGVGARDMPYFGWITK